MTSWLNNEPRLSSGPTERRSSDICSESGTSSTAMAPTSLMGGMSEYERDIKTVLHEIRNKVRSTNSKVQETNSKFDRLERSFTELRTSHDDLKKGKRAFASKS